MELTLDNVYQLLDNTEYTLEKITGQDPVTHQNNFKLQDWTDTMKLMLDSFWPGNRIKILNNYQPLIHGGRVYLNESYKDRMFLNVHQVSLNNFYQRIITKLNNVDPKAFKNEIDPYGEENWDDGIFYKQKLDWNSVKFPVLFDFLVENKEKIKERSTSDEREGQHGRVYRLLISILNYTYGAMNNLYSLIKCSNPGAVAETGRSIMRYFENTYPNHVIYIDVDEIYFSAFEEIREDIESKLKELKLDYDIDNYQYFLPLAKKNHVKVSDPKLIKYRGIREVPNLRIWLEKMEEVRRKTREKMAQRGNYWDADGNWVSAETPMDGIKGNWLTDDERDLTKKYKSTFYLDDEIAEKDIEEIIET